MVFRVCLYTLATLFCFSHSVARFFRSLTPSSLLSTLTAAHFTTFPSWACLLNLVIPSWDSKIYMCSCSLTSLKGMVVFFVVNRNTPSVHHSHYYSSLARFLINKGFIRPLSVRRLRLLICWGCSFVCRLDCLCWLSFFQPYAHKIAHSQLFFCFLFFFLFFLASTFKSLLNCFFWN